jgi:hypothetical protein
MATPAAARYDVAFEPPVLGRTEPASRSASNRRTQRSSSVHSKHSNPTIVAVIENRKKEVYVLSAVAGIAEPECFTVVSQVGMAVFAVRSAELGLYQV